MNKQFNRHGEVLFRPGLIELQPGGKVLSLSASARLAKGDKQLIFSGPGRGLTVWGYLK